MIRKGEKSERFKEKNNNIYMQRYIFYSFLVLPFIFLDQTAKKGSYIGEEGLKTALNALLTGITYKIVMGAMLGFVIWMIIYLIKIS